MNKFLQEVLEEGWNESRRRTFTQKYASLIRGNILYHLRHCFGGSQVRALGNYLEELQARTKSQPKGNVNEKQLTLVQNTWEEVFVKVFCKDKKGQNLIEKWASHVEEKKSKNEEFRDFETYLKGAVQIAFWKHLRKQKELENKVEAEPQEAQRWKTEGNQKEVSEEIPVQDEVSVYWDRLLRCQEPDPETINQDLVQLNREPKTVLAWACAKLKSRLSERGKEAASENLKAFLAFFCSHQGQQKDGPSPKEISSDGLTLDQVAGRYFRWRKDVCEEIFCKSIRKDRVTQKIRDILLDSPYRNMID